MIQSILKPDLPDCVAAADTLDATERLIRDALEFHLEGMRAHGDIPDPTTVAQYAEALILRAFAAALRREPAALASWKALIPSRKKDVLRYLAGLKSAEARERNIAKAVRVLAGERARFMSREWVGGA